MDSIEKLKYIPNASARNLKTADSKRIGVVLTDIENHYHAEIFKGISARLQNKKYNINIAFTNSSADIECETIDDFISSNISGLLLITSQPQNTDFFLSKIKNHNIPTVFIERRPSNIDTCFIGFDNDKTCDFLTEALLKKGYRNIGVLTGSQHFSSESDAVSGYKKALSKCGIPSLAGMIQMTNMTKEGAFKAILNHPYLEKLDAVITTSETMAVGVMEAFKLQGIRVPLDVQILTLGEESWNESTFTPDIIHTARTAFTLGTSAVDLLMKKIESPVLFEEKSLIFTDEIIEKELPVPACMKKAAAPPTYAREPLRILMADLESAHSARLLSRNFTLQTGIPVLIDFVPQSQLLGNIMEELRRRHSYYDIYMYDIPWLKYMVQNGLISDITEFVNSGKFEKEAFFEENLSNCKLDTQYYGIPFVGGSQIMFYRKDLFENRRIQKLFKERYQISLRPPRTWTEFNGIASFFTRRCNIDSPTEFGTSLAGITDEELAPEILIRLWANGGRLWDQYNRVCMDTPENRKALRIVAETLEFTADSPLKTSIRKTVADFCQGKTAMLVTYTEYANAISSGIQDNTAGRAGYAAVPGRISASVGWNLGVNPYTSKTEDVFLYFQWLCQKSTSTYMTILDGQSPAIAPYHSHELLKLYPWLELTEKSFAYCRHRNGPQSRNSLVIPQARIEAVLCSVLKNVIQNKWSILEALEKGQVEMTALFKSYGYPKPLHFLP